MCLCIVCMADRNQPLAAIPAVDLTYFTVYENVRQSLTVRHDVVYDV